VTVIGCRIRNHGTPFFIRLGNRDYDRQGRVGSIQNILFENIQMEGASPADDIGCAFSGLPGHPLRNVVVRDMEMGQWGGVSRVPNAADIPEKAADYPECGMFGVLPAYGFFVRHAEGVRFENVRIGWLHEDQRPWLTTINADVVTNNCRELGRVASPSGLVEYVEAESTTNLTAAEADLDVSASDGRFVALGGLDADKALSYGFRLTETSDVDLFVRARQPSGTTSGSAFKYRIDQSPWRSQPLYVSAVWSWSRLHADARHPLKGGSFANLKPGRHVLEIRPESAAELDLVRISCQRGAIETSAARATGPDAGVTTP
jgi:hypothetical protein